MHGNRIVFPNPKFISSATKQNEYFDEEILKKVNNTIQIISWKQANSNNGGFQHRS